MKNKTVIFLAHHALGDVLMKACAINYLIQEFGVENVYLTVQKPYIATFIEENFGISQSHMLIYDGANSSFKDKLRFFIRWTTLKVDIYIAPPTINERLSKILSLASTAKLRIRSSKIKQNKGAASGFTHKVYRNLDFVNEINPNVNVEQLADNLFYLPYFRKQSSKDNLVVLHPGSGELQRHKRIPVPLSIEIIRWFLDNSNYEIILTGFGASEDLICEELVRVINSPRLINKSSSLNLHELSLELSRSKLFISGDCGPAHLASIIGVQSIAVFGPTNEKITGAFKNSHVIRNLNPFRCEPCHKYGKSSLNVGCSGVDCLNQIMVESVVNEIQKILFRNE